ncbi:hypothetical protein [Nocardia sp. NPDC058666]|uniref:hypothetical protein n=1 Tax=Nocardia sp. NPDC058666 TaxID=3346587 RepID=UPI00364AFBB3
MCTNPHYALVTRSRRSGPGNSGRELGYFDQAHFSREFAAEIGMPPLEYARTAQASRAIPAAR